jgi:hypothetical protein
MQAASQTRCASDGAGSGDKHTPATVDAGRSRRR